VRASLADDQFLRRNSCSLSRIKIFTAKVMGGLIGWFFFEKANLGLLNSTSRAG
jgi:hypothetical protein